MELLCIGIVIFFFTLVNFNLTTKLLILQRYCGRTQVRLKDIN